MDGLKGSWRQGLQALHGMCRPRVHAPAGYTSASADAPWGKEHAHFDELSANYCVALPLVRYTIKNNAESMRMKNWLSTLLLLAVALLWIGISPLLAQTDEGGATQQLPTDPKVRIGRLDNGMTYYIRANAEPKNRAEFYILHNVGAILEEEDQNGLAHFTEHMAFNGTVHFPGKKLIGFLERNGVKFGADLNAFTTHDMTCYNISDVPTTDGALMDSCMQVLADWSGSISMDNQEIDNERGVIAEEWRTRRNAAWRAREAKTLELYKGSKYAERDVIGPLSLIKGFDYQRIKDFYHRWYRPDLQAIIVVGDFDVDDMEARIKKFVGEVPAPTNKEPRPVYDVPQAEGITYTTHVDPETQMSRIELIYKSPAVPAEKKDAEYYRHELISELAQQMLNARFDELAQQEGSPLVGGYNAQMNLVRPINEYMLIGVAKPGMLQEGLKSLITETQRARQKGFTASELERAKAVKLREVQKRYDERNKRTNHAYVFTYISHYTTGEPMLGVELESVLVPKILETIGVEDVNRVMAEELMPGQNLMMFLSVSDAEQGQLPSKEEATLLFEQIYGSDLHAWVDNTRNEPLVSKLPSPGSIKSTKVNKTFGTQEFTLSNGAKVIIKPTDFKDDEVQMFAFAMGGTSLAADGDVHSAELAGDIVNESGLGNFDATELRKLKAGKQVAVEVGLDDNVAYVSANSSAKAEELEMMMQEVYLHFTAPRFEEKAFKSFISQMESMLSNMERDPNSEFSRRLISEATQGAPRAQQLTLEALKGVSLARAKALYQQQFGSARNFTFIFVGNVTAEQIKPLVCQYLASLPAGNKLEWKDNNVRFPAKPRTLKFGMKMETPKTRFAKIYNSPAKYTAQNMVLIKAIEHVLTLRYTEEIREKSGSAYSVGVRGSILPRPVPSARMQIAFDTDPEKADAAIPMVSEIFDALRQEVAEMDVDKAKKHFLKAHAENVRKNRYWMAVLRAYATSGVDIHSGYEKEVNRLTAKSVQKAMMDLFKQTSYVEVEMEGAR